MLTHYVRHIIGYPDCFALLSCEPTPATAVIFVHGFKGHARKTWINFPTLIQDWKEWRQRDVYFYAYNSTTRQIVVNAGLLYQFIAEIFPHADGKKFGTRRSRLFRSTTIESDPRWTGSRTYSQVVLVGHSEGGVILRRAVLDAAKRYNRGRDVVICRGILNTTLCLFAPAIMGASLSGWQGGLLEIALQIPVLNVIPRVLMATWAAYHDLQPGSPVLVDTRTQTETFWSRQPQFAALCAQTIWGANEAIVKVLEYAHDDAPTIVPGKDHVSVCKPDAHYMKPLEYVSGRFRP